MYLFLFIQLYSFSKYIGRNTLSTVFQIPELTSILILSGLEFLNVATILKFLELKIAIGRFELVPFMLIVIVNYFYFLHGKRYKIMIKRRVFKEAEEAYGMIVSILYIILSVIFFIMVD